MRVTSSFRRTQIIIGILSLVFLLITPVSPQARKVVGQVTVVGGDFLVSGYHASAGTTLFEGDSVATGESPAVLALINGVRVHVAAHSEARLIQQRGQILVLPHAGSVRKSTDVGKADFSLRSFVTPDMSRSPGAGGAGSRPTPSTTTTLKAALSSQQTITAQSSSGGCPPNDPHCR
jgi:hypothetical protein